MVIARGFESNVGDNMAESLASGNALLMEFSRLIELGRHNAWEGRLRTGVDLGTANIVLSVVDDRDMPIAGAMCHSNAVRDGIVVDYMGAMRAVQALKAETEARLGTRLVDAACAIPPGIIEGNIKAFRNVVEAADFRLRTVVDEPTAAAMVLGIREGAVVDVGGGTTGISILKDGKVVFTDDEPTGGRHMTLVLAGFKGCSIEEAETEKRDPACEADVFPIIRPVVEKMASIIQLFLRSRPVGDVYVVGGACCFSQFEQVLSQWVGVPVHKPIAPLLATPLGIAMSCE